VYHGKSRQPVLLLILILIGLAAGNLVTRPLCRYVPLLAEKTVLGVDLGSIQLLDFCDFHFGLRFVFTPLGLLGVVAGLIIYLRLGAS